MMLQNTLQNILYTLYYKLWNEIFYKRALVGLQLSIVCKFNIIIIDQKRIGSLIQTPTSNTVNNKTILSHNTRVRDSNNSLLRDVNY